MDERSATFLKTFIRISQSFLVVKKNIDFSKICSYNDFTMIIFLMVVGIFSIRGYQFYSRPSGTTILDQAGLTKKCKIHREEKVYGIVKDISD